MKTYKQIILSILFAIFIWIVLMGSMVYYKRCRYSKEDISKMETEMIDFLDNNSGNLWEEYNIGTGYLEKTMFGDQMDYYYMSCVANDKDYMFLRDLKNGAIYTDYYYEEIMEKTLETIKETIGNDCEVKIFGTYHNKEIEFKWGLNPTHDYAFNMADVKKGSNVDIFNGNYTYDIDVYVLGAEEEDIEKLDGTLFHKDTGDSRNTERDNHVIVYLYKNREGFERKTLDDEFIKAEYNWKYMFN